MVGGKTLLGSRSRTGAGLGATMQGQLLGGGDEESDSVEEDFGEEVPDEDSSF